MRIRICSIYLMAFSLANAVLGACLLDDYSVSAEYARSVAVVEATVASIRTVRDQAEPEFISGTIYALRIHASFRGPLTNTVDVFSENTSGRFPIEKGKRYLLFLHQDGNQLSADNCGNSGLVSQKKSVLETVRALRKANATDKKT